MGDICCPTCGNKVEEVPMKALLDSGLPPQIRRIVKAMVAAYPRPARNDELLAALYWDDPNGGPDGAERVLMTRICNARKILAPFGWTVSKQGTGSHGRYRLQKIEEA